MYMNSLFEQYHRRLNYVPMDFVREIESSISWDARLIGIKGARGSGKTTLLLQHIKKHFSSNLGSALYVSLDNLWFASHRLTELVDYFMKIGGTHIFLDEVHKYPDWAIEIKNLYDGYPSLHIAFTGSSLLEILNERADLSRRALVYSLPGLSFREYLELETGESLPVLSLTDVLYDSGRLSAMILQKIKPFAFFSKYLEYGYYPYYREGAADYPRRLEETVLMILEQELPFLRGIEPSYVPKLKQLLSVIAESAPFIPNISKLSERIGLNRQTLLHYLNCLQEANLLRQLYRAGKGISRLQKPEKLFLDNTNLMYLLSDSAVSKGNLRETFAANQIAQTADIRYSRQSDFLVDGKYTIEVGGRNKTRKQLQGLEDAYIAADDIEYGYGRRIPLWLFGFMY